MDVGASIEQDPHALEKTMRGSEVQGRHVVAVLARVRVRTMRQQELRRLRVPHGEMQTGATALVTRRYETRVRGEAVPKSGNIAACARLHELRWGHGPSS